MRPSTTPWSTAAAVSASASTADEDGGVVQLVDAPLVEHEPVQAGPPPGQVLRGPAGLRDVHPVGQGGPDEERERRPAPRAARRGLGAGLHLHGPLHGARTRARASGPSSAGPALMGPALKMMPATTEQVARMMSGTVICPGRLVRSGPGPGQVARGVRRAVAVRVAASGPSGARSVQPRKSPQNVTNSRRNM